MIQTIQMGVVGSSFSCVGEEQADGGDEQDGGEEVADPVEAGEQAEAGGDEGSAHEDGAEDAPEEHLGWLAGVIWKRRKSRRKTKRLSTERDSSRA